MNKLKASYCLLFIIFISKNVCADQPTHIPDVTMNNQRRLHTITGVTSHTLTRQQLAMTGASTLSEALHANAGLQLHDASGTGSQVQIGMRGFGANASSNALFLINGMPLTNPDIAPPDLNTLPLEDISRIEIISGSESVLYGDQAVGGTINIFTDDTVDKNLRLQCMTGSYNTRACHASLTNTYRTINYQANLTHKTTDNYRDHNDYINDTLLGSFASHPSKNDYIIDYKLTHENMQYPGALTAPQVWQNRRQASNSTDYFKDNNAYLHLHSHNTVYNKWAVNTDTFVRDMDGSGVLFAPFSQSRRSFFFRPELGTDFGEHKFTTGLDARLDQYHLESAYGLTNNRQQQGGLFSLFNAAINQKLRLILGARGAEQTTQLNTNVSAYTLNRAAATTLGITYELNQQLSFYLRRAGSYRFPKAEENSASNQPLRTQRGISYESGLSYDINNDVYDFAIYQLNLRDEIAFDPLQTPQNPFGTNTNLAPTARTGANLAGKHILNRFFTLDAQLNYVYARFRNGVDAGKQIPLVSDWTARGGLTSHLTQYFQAYAEAVFTGRQYPANDNANVSGGQGGYTLYNFNLRYQYHAFSATLHINNIFNTNYYLYTVYQTGPVSEYFYPAPERNYMLTLNYLFS